MKNLNDIRAEVIADKALLGLDIYISATKYLENEAVCFTKVNEDNEKTNEELETVSDLGEKIKIKQVFYKEKGNV